jgi:hypothetical protein
VKVGVNVGVLLWAKEFSKKSRLIPHVALSDGSVHFLDQIHAFEEPTTFMWESNALRGAGTTKLCPF